MGLEDKRNVDDFVTYCQKIQKRQDKEKRRSRGETVSSDSDDSWEEHNVWEICASLRISLTSTFIFFPFKILILQIKHPYAIPKAEPIKINIVVSFYFWIVFFILKLYIFQTASSSTGQLALPSSEIVDEAELRVVFPVSSGVVHKENAVRSWFVLGLRNSMKIETWI